MLFDIKKTVLPYVKSGLEPQDDDGWTPAQYAAAVRLLLASPARAVPADVVKAKFGGGGEGKRVLQAMVRANLLSYRPFSYWARDLDRSAFQGCDVVITAPTPAHLACMRQLTLPESAP